MSRVREVAPKVLMVLKDFPDTREDDKELILKVYQHHYGVRLTEAFASVMWRKDLPTFESIRRARQRIQAECPELRASADVERVREDERKEYVKFSKEAIV